MVFRDAPIVVWAVTAFHVVVAVLLLVEPAAGQSTGPAEVVQWLGRDVAIGAMLLSSGLAVAAITRSRNQSWITFALLLPQQVLLYLAAWGGIDAIVEGQYADGVSRPVEFITTDQLPMILFAFVHTIAILEIPWRD